MHTRWMCAAALLSTAHTLVKLKTKRLQNASLSRGDHSVGDKRPALALCPTSSSSLQFQHVGSSITSSYTGENQGGKGAACLCCALPCGPPWLFAFRAREMRDSKPLAVRPDPRAERDRLRLFGNHNQVYGAISGRLLHSGHISHIDLSYLILAFIFITFARQVVVFSLGLKGESGLGLAYQIQMRGLGV
ncbi:hypothetical protein HDV63DRAFT_275552 [Trichoderma sp. SZMC 28014]